MLSAPCKGCGDRSASCHGSCGKYRAWTDDRRALLDLRLAAREADEIQIEAIYKIKRKRRNKL